MINDELLEKALIKPNDEAENFKGENILQVVYSNMQTNIPR